MLRFIKSGDIFCFKFMKIISKVTTGHLAEILDCVSDKPYDGCFHFVRSHISKWACMHSGL